jgi:hypothetical protein
MIKLKTTIERLIAFVKNTFLLCSASMAALTPEEKSFDMYIFSLSNELDHKYYVQIVLQT